MTYGSSGGHERALDNLRFEIPDEDLKLSDCPETPAWPEYRTIFSEITGKWSVVELGGHNHARVIAEFYREDEARRYAALLPPEPPKKRGK